MPMVNTCVVLVIGEEGEDKYLVAYIVPEGKTNKKEVRALLKRRLPFYMVPAYFVFLSRCVNGLRLLIHKAFDKRMYVPLLICI